MRLRLLHRAAAILLGAFTLVHLANHLVGLAGFEQHLAFLRMVRIVYRHPWVEPLLLAAVAVQGISGLLMLARGWRRRRAVFDRIQMVSGAYLLLFLAIHVAAVLIARSSLGLDTHLHFASAGLHVWPMAWFFVPYYGLAVTALWVHLACAAHRRLKPIAAIRPGIVVGIAAAAGVLMAACLLTMMAGWWYPMQIPDAYLAPYR